MTIHLSHFTFDVLMAIIKILVVFHVMLIAVPVFVLMERAIIAKIQQRDGPNRVGIPLGSDRSLFRGVWFLGGLLQTIVDGLKLFLKEDIRPNDIEKPLHTLAPLITVIAAIFALAIIPFGPVVEFSAHSYSLLGLTFTFDPGAYKIPFSITDLDIGILFYMAIAGVGVYGIVLAGWASNSKYALLGGIRSSAQMLSYEIALGLSIVGVLLIAGTFNLREVIAEQDGGIWTWHFIKQPLGFLLFMCAGFAETNRLPFDLPEGESELGAGFHTEFSSMKFALFFQAEYINMTTSMSILTTLFLGGFHAPIPALMIGAPGSWLYAFSGVFWFILKILALISFMIFIRGTLPRFRYDQLMDLGWKVLFPVALINLVVTAVVMAFAPEQADQVRRLSAGITIALCVAGLIQIFIIDAYLTARKKRLINAI